MKLPGIMKNSYKNRRKRETPGTAESLLHAVSKGCYRENRNKGSVIVGQKIVKKHKENSENLLKNMVCKRLTYNCSNGILQVKESYTESSGYSQSASLLAHNRIAALQLIRSGLYHS